MTLKRAGVAAEVGTQYRISRRFFGEVKYAYGFSRLLLTDYSSVINGKRNTLRFSLGYNFSDLEKRQANSDLFRLRPGLSVGQSLAKNYGIMLGTDLSVHGRLSPGLSLTLSGGYNHYFLKNNISEETHFTFLPFKLGLRHYMGKGLYIEPGAGIAFGLQSEAFTRAAVFGVATGIDTKSGFDIGLRYEKMSGRTDSIQAIYRGRRSWRCGYHMPWISARWLPHLKWLRCRKKTL